MDGGMDGGSGKFNGHGKGPRQDPECWLRNQILAEEAYESARRRREAERVAIAALLVLAGMMAVLMCLLSLS